MGVIVEIAGADGEMLRGPDLAAFSRAHAFIQTSIADLVAYLDDHRAEAANTQ